MLLKGENSKGVSTSNSFILTYANRCDVIPFSTDDSIGWNSIVGIDPPPYQLCPLCPPPATDAPTSAPTIAPITGKLFLMLQFSSLFTFTNSFAF